jgi:hypothetical protein
MWTWSGHCGICWISHPVVAAMLRFPIQNYEHAYFSKNVLGE